MQIQDWSKKGQIKIEPLPGSSQIYLDPTMYKVILYTETKNSSFFAFKVEVLSLRTK